MFWENPRSLSSQSSEINVNDIRKHFQIPAEPTACRDPHEALLARKQKANRKHRCRGGDTPGADPLERVEGGVEMQQLEPGSGKSSGENLGEAEGKEVTWRQQTRQEVAPELKGLQMLFQGWLPAINGKLAVIIERLDPAPLISVFAGLAPYPDGEMMMASKEASMRKTWEGGSVTKWMLRVPPLLKEGDRDSALTLKSTI